MSKNVNLVAVLRVVGATALTIVQAPHARAQDAGITVLSQGENFAVRYGEMNHQNRLGGQTVVSVTGGEGGGITYRLGEPDQRPMIPHVSGGGESQEITYSLPSTSASMLAGAASGTELAEAEQQRR